MSSGNLRDAEKDPTDNQPLVARHGGGTARDDTPRDHDPGDPSSRCEILHGDVGWEFEQDVWAKNEDQRRSREDSQEYWREGLT